MNRQGAPGDVGAAGVLEISGLQKVIDRNTVLEVGALTVGAGEVVAITEISASPGGCGAKRARVL